MPEPPDHVTHDDHTPPRPFRHLIGIPTLRWLMVAAIGNQVATYAAGTFLVPLLQRWFGMPISRAALGAGLVLGAAGLIAYPVAGFVLDRAAQHSFRARLVVGACGATLAAPLALWGLAQPPSGSTAFLVLLAVGWFVGAFMGVAALSALSDVVPSRLRATAVAFYMAAGYLFGGSLGPLLAGGLSDYYTHEAALRRGPLPGSIPPEAMGLHHALLLLVPLAFTVAALAAWMATRTIARDHDRLTAVRHNGPPG